MPRPKAGVEFLELPKSPYRVPFDGSFSVGEVDTRVRGHRRGDDDRAKKELSRVVDDLAVLQRKLYAQDRHAVLLIFQALDAAGKDSTIRAVFSGVNPAGFQVFSFKAPSAEELDHDFLWRSARRLPERGRIGVFNRSYYEEVLVVRVHPELLDRQALPDPHDRKRVWKHRFESIRSHELHLARNGTVVLKFWLNVSRAEQRRRFLARMEEPKKQWKFSRGDVEERRHWGDYMHAYEECLNETSTRWAPWYAIPADSKPAMRLAVAEILKQTLVSMELTFPSLTPAEEEDLEVSRRRLEEES